MFIHQSSKFCFLNIYFLALYIYFYRYFSTLGNTSGQEDAADSDSERMEQAAKRQKKRGEFICLIFFYPSIMPILIIISELKDRKKQVQHETDEDGIKTAIFNISQSTKNMSDAVMASSASPEPVYSSIIEKADTAFCLSLVPTLMEFSGRAKEKKKIAILQLLSADD
jgi:hypothetical protein